MEGDVEDMTIIKELYGEMAIISDTSRKKKEYAFNDRAPNIKRLNAATNTDNKKSYIKEILQVPNYVTYRAKINLTAVKPILQECGYENEMSRDTRYFAQTLRKYPLPKPHTKSSDLIQEKIKRSENKKVYRKTGSKNRSVRRTASHQAVRTNAVVEYDVQDTRRLTKVEEILPTSTKEEGNSGHTFDVEYNYLNSKTKQRNVDVRYCTSTKRACTCRRMKNIVCTKPENCPNVRHRLNNHRQFYHNQENGKKPSCHCNVCQAKREPPSTSSFTPSEYARKKRKDQEEEVQLLSRNYLGSSHHAIDFEKEIMQWTKAKLHKESLVQMKLIQKLAKALSGLSEDKGLLPEARHEVVKYLTALSVFDPNIKEKLGAFADDFLNELSQSLKNKRSKTNIENSNEKSYVNYVNNSSSRTKMLLKHFLYQLPIKKDNEQLDFIAEKFLKILKEQNINVELSNDIRDSPNPKQCEEKDYYLNRILSWYKRIPELAHLEIYDSIQHFQDIANKLHELNKRNDLKENTHRQIKLELIKWLKDYLALHNVSYSESFEEILIDKLIEKLLMPAQKNIHYKGLTEKDWITKEIYSLLKHMDAEIFQNEDVPVLINSLILRLSYLKDKNYGNLTLHQCKNELNSWFKYLEHKNIFSFHENEKAELERNILSRMKVLFKHEKHINCCHLKRLKLLAKTIFEEINRLVVDNSNISHERLLQLISNIISVIFKTQVNEKLISRNMYEKVSTILRSLLTLPAEDIKGLVQSILDKIVQNDFYENLKDSDKIKDDGVQTKLPSKKVYKSQFITSTPRPSQEEFLSNLNGDSTSFSHLINENLLQKIIEDWLKEKEININELEKQNILKVIIRDIIYRYNYDKAFSKSKSDLEEIEYFKYFIFKELDNYIKKQKTSSNIKTSNVNNLYDTYNKTLTQNAISEERSMANVSNNQNENSLEVLKSKLVNAFINLNSYLVDERLKNEYKGKLKEEINKFCSQYLKRFPAMLTDREQLRSNIYNALDNVPKPLQTKSEINIVSEIEKWLDELSNKNNIIKNDNENIVSDLVNSILEKKKIQLTLYDNGNEISETISKWLQSYSKKQKTFLDSRYWTEKLLEKLKSLDTSKELNLSKVTNQHMYTIPEAESFGAQVEESIMQSKDNNEIAARDLLSAEDRELLSAITDRSLPNDVGKSEIDFVTDTPEQELLLDVGPKKLNHDLVIDVRPNIAGENLVADVRPSKHNLEVVHDVRPQKPEQELLPNVLVHEYHWESNEQTQTSQTMVDEPPGVTDKTNPERRQPKSLDHAAQTTFSDLPKIIKDETNECLNPGKSKRTKLKPCKLRKRLSTRSIKPPLRVICPNRYTLKSKDFNKDLMCNCSDCVINKRKIEYFSRKFENVDLQNCPECFGGYCPYPSCAYFE